MKEGKFMHHANFATLPRHVRHFPTCSEVRKICVKVTLEDRRHCFVAIRKTPLLSVKLLRALSIHQSKMPGRQPSRVHDSLEIIVHTLPPPPSVKVDMQFAYIAGWGSREKIVFKISIYNIYISFIYRYIISLKDFHFKHLFPVKIVIFQFLYVMTI